MSNSPTDRLVEPFGRVVPTKEQAVALATVTTLYQNMAAMLRDVIPERPELTVAIRKLRESKETAVVAICHPPAAVARPA